MKKKLQPIPVITKAEASYEKLMLQTMSKLVSETRENNGLMREFFGKEEKSNLNKSLQGRFRDTTNIISRNKSNKDFNEGSPRIRNKTPEPYADQEDYVQKNMRTEPSGFHRRQESPLCKDINRWDRFLKLFEEKMSSSQDINKKLLEKLDSFENYRNQKQASIPSKSKEIKQEDLSLIERALNPKQKSNIAVTNPAPKKSYVILSQILPYSDRRQMKVKFKISDIVAQDQQVLGDDIKTETCQWLGMVYRATASICWNMLLNSFLTFEEIKILFTQNIVFNFIQFMNELKPMRMQAYREQLTQTINQKSCEILDFLCKQYPQTKIQAPNIALRGLLPQIDNQLRIKFDLVSRSGINLIYREDGDYTAEIMRIINFMIDKTNDDYDSFLHFMKNTFEQIFLPIHKRHGFNVPNSCKQIKELVHDDLIYKQKVKTYTKYLIGRKIPKNTSKYSEQQIEDGVFFVKSTGILRVITKWVEQLMEYITNPDQKIKNSYGENKDHSGKILYLSSLLKNGIYKCIIKDKQQLMKKITEIKRECYRMEMLLTEQNFTSDQSQVHLSDEQISVGKYCSNLKSAISSYICSQLNELIHYLLKVPKCVNESELGIDQEDFKTQARKDLDSVNLVTLKLFDLLRCKIHSNEEQIIWIVQYLIEHNKLNKEKFGIVRIKDRLNLGTRDIMINAQINKGMVCEIQLSVTSNTDKKQELLDQYNHFLYELKRSKLGPITQNVSIWATLEQRYSYFEQLIKQKRKDKPTDRRVHQCGGDSIHTFKRPIICKSCENFYPIPQTCLLNVECTNCGVTFCGECYYYNFLSPEERKQYIFQQDRLLKREVREQLIQYTDFTQPFPQTGFFIKKKFLKKELSFYMAIQKNKDEKVKSEPITQLIIVQTIIRNEKILNRQVNKKQIQAKLENGQFFINNYKKTELNNFIIFYFKGNKKLSTINDIQSELQKPDNRKTRVLSIVKEPSYISKLNLLKKDTDKIRQLSYLRKIVGGEKVTTYRFPNLIIIAQVCVKGSLLREEITKKVNTSSIKSFAYKESDIVSMEHKGMSVELEQIAWRMKPLLYDMFCHNLKKLFLTHGNIKSIACFAKFTNLEFAVVSENKITSLQGIEKLENLLSFRFDDNQVENVQPFTNLINMRYISGNKNNINSIRGLENCKQLKTLSLFENNIENVSQITSTTSLEELYLRGNPISDMSPIITLTGLVKLFIGRTKIKNVLDMSSLTKLKSLSLEGLQLNSVPESFRNIKLNELWLSCNQISKIQNLQEQSDLTLLNLSKNKISKIQNLNNLFKLEFLKLARNNIEVISGLSNIMDGLKCLDLKENPIEEMKQLFKYQFTFNLELSQNLLSDNAKRELEELQAIQQNFSTDE